MNALVKATNNKPVKAGKRKGKGKKPITDEAEKDSTLLWVLLSMGTIGGIAGLVSWANSRREKEKQAPSTPSTQPSNPSLPSLPEIAAQLRAEHLKVENCVVNWKLGEASRTGLMAHYGDFFAPAIADAHAKGAASIDEITVHVASLLVPGCPWPPAAIMAIDIEAALAGKLDFVGLHLWPIVQGIGAVKVYMTIRQLVSTVIAQGRRG